MSRILAEDLIGQVVHDAAGQPIGRIYEMRAEERNGAIVVVEYHLGTGAMLERLGLSLLQIAGGPGIPEPRTIPWDRLDVSNPSSLKLRNSER
jgi:hypothetical protein